MKQLLIMLSLIALSCAKPKFTTPEPGFACMCQPEPPVCASNGESYPGVCNMKCAQHWIEERLYVLHDGECNPTPPY